MKMPWLAAIFLANVAASLEHVNRIEGKSQIRVPRQTYGITGCSKAFDKAAATYL